MKKNQKIPASFKKFFVVLALANLLTVLLPILLAFYFLLFVVGMLTDNNNAQELTYVYLIASLSVIGIFVLITNIITALMLLKKYKLSSKQDKTVKGLLAVSILLPIAYICIVLAIQFV